MANQKEDKAFLDEHQYSEENIDHYELIFGKQFVSTGGKQTIRGFAERLQLKRGENVLDFGSGLGGCAFYLSTFGVNVLGVDVSKNMISKANGYLSSADAEIQRNVKFELRDVAKEEFPAEHFDAIFTRETIVHIHDKEPLFQQFYKSLKNEGRLLISDYCLGSNSSNVEFQNYIRNRNYLMIPLPQYKDMLEQVGFSRVELTDLTDDCIDILKKDVNRLKNMRDELLQKLTVEAYDGIVKGWETKLQRCQNGNQGWGLILAIK